MRYTMYFHFLLLALLFIFPATLRSEDGSQLWLRFSKQVKPVGTIQVIKGKSTDVTLALAKQELECYWKGGDVILKLDPSRKDLKDGYQISQHENQVYMIAGQSVGILYAVYHLLRLQETGAGIPRSGLVEIPAYDIRVLNHWDNLDGTIERGYAGHSLWNWEELPNKLSPRYEQYGRANASIGINATVLNNVNASSDLMKTDYLKKVKALADVFRKYGIKVYVSINFSSPQNIGGLTNSDPLNQEVKRWWKSKVKEIYALIPDFGGFLVKANSEGQPGPQDYGRTHADGANMLADALSPYGGTVFWRAFVYHPTKDDRAKQAYQEFVPLDGQFRDNVILQVKNGPIDFQPREPFNPLLGAMPNTAKMLEFQLTQEYLGFSNHLVYLAPLFKEVLDSDTYANRKGQTVSKLTDNRGHLGRKTAIAAVSNIGLDTNWTGHHFAQANWYAFGRLAWNNNLSSVQIADEWIRMTFTGVQEFIDPIKKLMLESREAAVDYMMPLGLHHLFAFEHHYGPEPWGDIPGGRPDWMPWYYHNADSVGLGFDRTVNGSRAVTQYNPPLNKIYGNISTCPENLLLWFHHVSWNYRMNSGNTLWTELCFRYDHGVQKVREFQKVWDRMEKYIDRPRFLAVQAKLRIQARDAVWWKDACLQYFQCFSRQPIPYELERPIHNLEELKKIKLPMGHHN
ncbi:alpha-glucuronidase [Sphingobacterium siyangense]|uniref:alpha-glucuronidase n=1 Tax=Sphingobacterium siyangense TaxID=459529 RepID=UPI001918905D|nr:MULTISPECIES: alpha-glucuronidase [Sphingobacterium]QQT29325.1 alpha-glucuronidase [Sphingobacterium multivorum]QRY59871.1 alpha-glucuronidase [Sphingobacterium siyangense]